MERMTIYTSQGELGNIEVMLRKQAQQKPAERTLSWHSGM
jgi:hypothetical protein